MATKIYASNGSATCGSSTSVIYYDFGDEHQTFGDEVDLKPQAIAQAEDEAAWLRRRVSEILFR